MKIQIEGQADQLRKFSSEVYGELRPILPGSQIPIGNATNLKLESISEVRALDIPSVLSFIVESAITIDIGLATTWLYEKCNKSGISTIIIDGERTKIDLKEIEKRLAQELNKLDKNK